MTRPSPFTPRSDASRASWRSFAILNRYYDRPAELPPQEINGRPNYNFGPDQIRFRRRDVLGHRRFYGRAHHRLPACLARAQSRSALDHLRPAAAAAYLGGDLRVRRQRADRDLVLRRAEDLPHAPRRRSRAVVRRARLQFLHPDRRHRLSARRHAVQGICRAGMVRGSVADDRLGHLSAGVPDDAGEAQGTAHLRRQLVLSRLHRHHRGAASRQQSRAAGVVARLQILHRLGRRAGRDVPVVVRPQRGRLLPDRRLPRHHVLLHPEARGAADLFLPALHHPFLGADLPLHLGRPAPPALHGAAGLGADARHDLLDHAVDAVLGRHDQRPA